jgi:hypothetical protein
VALPFTLKSILKAKEELWKLKYLKGAFSMLIDVVFEGNRMKGPSILS